MTPPTLSAFVSGGFTGTTAPKTAAVAPVTGDLLVCVGVTETGSTTLATPTGGSGITWTLRQSQTNSNFAPVYIWTAPVASGQSFSVSVTRASGSAEFGMACAVMHNHGGLGNSGSNNGTTGNPSVTFTAAGDNSSLIVVSSDWNTVATTKGFTTVNGSNPIDEIDATGQSRYYVYIYTDAGTNGSKAPGLSAPAGQKWQIAAIEILGVTPSGGVQPSAGFFASDF